MEMTVKALTKRFTYITSKVVTLKRLQNLPR